MTPERLAKMRAGRVAAAQRRHDEGIERVRQYRAWLTQSRRKPDGTWPRVSMPAIPTDEEWAKARERGVVA